MKRSFFAAALAVVVLGAPSFSFACTAEDVNEKLATVTETTEYQEADQQTVVEAGAMLQEATLLAGEGKAEEACELYMEVEAMLGIEETEVPAMMEAPVTEEAPVTTDEETPEVQ